LSFYSVGLKSSGGTVDIAVPKSVMLPKNHEIQRNCRVLFTKKASQIVNRIKKKP
jgi:hypothetical protein